MLMLRESGDKTFPVWLLGDSNPGNWEDKLDYPLDSRHPIRHNIWTPIADIIQDYVYIQSKQRINFAKLFKRNAVDKSDKKPESNLSNWGLKKELMLEIEEFKELIIIYKPKIILTLGAFSFEFGRRCLNEDCQFSYNVWTAEKLGIEFRDRVKINSDETNLIPLLHRSISGGKFLTSHEKFCNCSNTNYFNIVGLELGKKFIQYENIYL